MVTPRAGPGRAATAALLQLLLNYVSVETARPRVNSITPRHVGFGGGEIAIMGSDFAEDQYSQFQPELGNIVNFVNDWDTVPCKVNVYKTSRTRIICTVGPLRADRGLGNWYQLHLTVDGQRVHTGWSFVYHDGYTPRVDSVEPAAGPPGSLVTIRGRFFTDRYSIDTKTAGDLTPSDVSIEWIRVGGEDCDPVDPTSGELYGLTSSEITCRTSTTFAGPLSVQVMVSGRGLSLVKDNKRLVSSQDDIYDFLAVPQVTGVSPSTLAAGGGAVITVDGAGFDPSPNATEVTVGGASCRVLTVTPAQLTCSAPAEGETAEQKQGGSGLLYEVWLDAEVTDLGDLSALTSDTDGYRSEVLLGASVGNNSFGQAAADGDKFVGRLSGWLRAPHQGQIALTLKSDGAAQLRVGPAPDALQTDPAVETSGNFNSVQKSALINVTNGEMMYFEATHKQGGSGDRYRLQVGLIDYSSPVTRDQTTAATTDTQTIFVKGELKLEQQILTFEGVPATALGAVQLEYNGVQSQTPVDASTATNETWKSAVEDMFSARCTYAPMDQAFVRTYEEEPPATSRETGNRQNEAIEPWCDSWVLYKPWGGLWTANTNHEIRLTRHRWFCLAHWGTISGDVRVLIEHRNDNGVLTNSWKQFGAQLPSGQSWSYSCVDLVAKLEEQGVVMPAKLREVRVPFNWADDVYFDDISFSAGEKTTPSRRPAARLGSEPLFVREVGVATSADPLTVTVTLRVARCANQLPLIRLAGTNASAVADTSALGRLVMSADGWGQGIVTNVRNVSASPPPAGSWDISFNGVTVRDVPTNLTSEGMTLLLSTQLSLPGLVAHRWGECNNYHWNVLFKHHGGRQPPITVNGANVVFQGNNLQVSVWKDPNNGDGRVTHEVLPADLSRLPRSAAGRQVKVAVHGVTGSCKDDDCDITFDASLNAAISAVAAAIDASTGDTTVTISGTGLGSAPASVTVTLTSAAATRSCAVTAATGTEVTCTVKALHAGRYTAAVTVTGGGAASSSGEVAVAPGLVSISPAEGSPRGGTVVTLSGSRMPLSAAGWEDGQITVGGATCDVINSTSSAASCRISGDVGSAGAAVDVTVTFGDQSAALTAAFTALSDNAAITALNVTAASAAGGEYLGITGTGFGRLQADQSVTVGGASCDVTGWADTQIGCRLPPLGHGEHKVEVIRGQLGLADNSAVGTIGTMFKVSDVSPRLASAAGGSVIRLRGAGLAADCDRLNVTVGDLFTCDLLTCADAEVTCRLQPKRRRHVIRNNVDHPRYGPGYLWEPQRVTVAPGDLVTWRWVTGQVSSDALGFAVHQTATQDTDEYQAGGFNSGEKSQQGSFTTMLEDIGTVYYSGPPAGTSAPYMRGVIDVQAPPVGDGLLSVRLGPVEATHVPATESVPNFEPSELCSSDEAPDACPGTDNPLQVQSAGCVTPRVTEVTVTQGGQGGLLTADSELTLVGSGFTSTVCHHRVMIGAGTCDVTAASANQLTCRVTAAGVPHGVGQPLMVSVANRGNAVIDVPASSKYFRWEPTVTGSSPASGSPTGGTLLTITGSGLLSGSEESPPRVTVGSAPCVVQTVSLSELTCLTPAGAAGDPVPVRLEWQDSEGQTRTVGDTTFTYDPTKTPTLSSAEFTAGAERTIAISGVQLGTDPSKITINLIPRTTERRKRQAEEEVEHFPDEVTDMDDELAVPPLPEEWDDDVVSLDDAEEVDPAVAAARREDAAFWRRFCHGDCDSFGAFATSGQLRAAGSGPNIPVTGATRSSTNSEPEQDFIELTPEYVSELREASHHGRRARRRVHLRRRRAVSSTSSTQLTCDQITITDSGATCQLPDDLSGSFDVQVQVDDLGAAAESVAVSVTPAVTTGSLAAGSVHGGALVRLDGSGFGSDVTVTVGGEVCTLTSSTATSVQCLTPAGEAGAQPVVVTSGGLSANGPDYTYATASTPVITSVTSQDSGGTSVVSGEGTALGTAAGSYLMVGGRRCTVTSLTDTAFSCQLESYLPGGVHGVTFHAPEGTGDSAPVDLTVTLEVTSVSPTTAGLSGTTLTIAGGKFDTVSPVTVTVCDTACQVTGVTSTAVTCLAPAVSAAPAAACDVIVTLTGGASVSADAAFTYNPALTASATSVSPTRGGTAGGTTITVTGTGFAATGNAVSIDGVPCDVTSESVTEVTCVTNGHAGAGEFNVMVDVPGIGFAQPAAEAQFQYVDRWSSVFTWGGSDPPSAGQSVSITAGQTILLDTSTPVLRLILIDGGELIFDPDAAFLELNAEYIVVVGGGRVQIGTEESPHQGQAAITLHGNVRATELPVYGAKVLAVRNGTLDLHGRPLDITWTYLGSTAAAGASTITLDRAVSWAVGDEIVIATTGDKFSMGESEKHVISAVSADGLTLTLESPLAHEHISSEQTFAGRTVRMRAEVGLLTRNVKVRGSVNDEFTEQVNACAAGFQPGQFDVQTCFHGRYGAETITDQFGATVMIHAKYQNQHLVTGRLEYVEVTEAGQAFRLGRYPIHFHLNGNVTGSYVRGCAIHRTYNRAVTIHAVDYLLVEHNVAYNIMGHAFFTEDGIEAYNVIQYNLAVFTRTSSSLLNVDVTPASYWVVNPTNIVRHNAAAGGSHFGYWYRTEAHPSGPSFTSSYCPNHAPMGEFYNNSAHSFGRYGLWVFSMDGYFPLSGGEDTCSGQPDVARFGQFLAWRCERGAEVVLGGSLRFENFTVVDNEMAGLEMVKVKGPFGRNGPGVQNALVVGRSAINGDACTEAGIITPKQYIFNVDGATFVNFDKDSCTALAGCSQCKPDQGGFHHQFRGVVYENAPNKMKWKWTHESVFHDTDGSLSGEEDGVVLPWTDILPPASCTKGLAGFDMNSQVVTAVCDSSVTIHRMAFNQPSPSSLLYKTANFTTRHGTTSTMWQKKRLTHASGWMALLVEGETHALEWADSNQLTNISYEAGFYFLKSADRLAISHAMLQKPDRFQAGGAASNGSGPPLDFATGKHGDIHWNNDTYTMSYMVAGQSRARRAVGPFEDRDKGVMKTVGLVVERCFFEGCLPPPVPTVPTGRPDTVQLWSQATEDKWTVPGEMEDVTIPADLWVVTDVALPPIRRLIIYGVLEIADDMDNVLNCTHIVVYGKMVAGTMDAPFQHQLTILLRGRHRVGADAGTADIPMPDGSPNIGWKALAAYGALELYGTPRSAQWRSLAASVAAGADSVTLDSPVDWPVGVEVVITTSSFESRETEVRRVTAVEEGRLTLNASLQYAHIATEVSLPDGRTVVMAAKVGLLTQNIRIEGDSYDDVIGESFGARVLASSYYEADTGLKKTATVRLSNVEFRLAGQDGWSDSYDPRYALTLHSLGDTDATVVNCSFNHLFSPAIGVFYSNNVTVRGSVVMHAVGSGIIDEGTGNRLENNLVSWLVFPGTYNGRVEPDNLSWDAAFRVHKATDPVLVGNVVAGSERLGFHISGTDCGVASKWSGNEAHGAFHGVHMFDQIKHQQCAKVSGFFVWRSWDFGIYFHVSSSSVIVDGNILIENSMNILPMLYLPDPIAHQFENKRLTVSNTVVVAVASADHCAADVAPAIAAFRSLARAPRTESGGRSGIVWGQFISRKVGAPKKTWHNPMSYPAIRGNTYISGVHLVNFNRLCSGQRDIAISTLVGGDDAQHPLFTDTVTFTNVNEADKLFMHTPVLSHVNPSDCVDMDCDGQKHALLIDTDGSVIGAIGTAVPQAEYQFDGDPRHGVGYYRVPESAITELDGSRIPYADKMPNKGVWRGSDCTWKDSWRAYTCPGGQQRMLVIESMDADTEIRRVSPIALIADPGSGGFVDLLNGPQDQGWCFGYTCQERLSTFYSLVAPGRLYEMHFTGTPPQHLRFHFLNAEPDMTIVLKIWYPKTQRYDVYYEGEFVYPTNVEPDTFNIIQSETPEDFIPIVTSTKHGENYFQRREGFLHVVVRGPGLVEIKQQPVIVLKMGFVAESDFFETDVLNRLSDLLGISPSQLRVANIVREDSTIKRRRRRRETAKTEVEFEIGSSPATNTSSGGSNDTMSIEQLQETQAKAVDSFQTGSMDEALGVQVEDIQMVDPEPVATDPTGGVRATNETGDEDLSGVDGVKTYAEIQREEELAKLEAESADGVSYERPSEMALDSAPISGETQELTRLSPLVKLYMKNAQGDRMTAVGHASSPWQVQAELISPPAGVTLLNSRTPFESGVATFSRLMVSGVGTGLRLRFRVVQPADVTFSVEMMGSFATTEKQLQLRVAGNLGAAWHAPGQRISPGVRVEIGDPATGGLATAAALRGYSWVFRATLYKHADGTPTAALQGTRRMELPAPSGESSYDPAVVFDNLMISPAGWSYLIQFDVTTPDDSSIRLSTVAGPFQIQSLTASNVPAVHTIGLRIRADFSRVANKQLPFSAEVASFLQKRYNSHFTAVSLSEGSIVVAATSRDTSEDAHQETVEKLQEDLGKGLTMTAADGTEYPFDDSLLVDGAVAREPKWRMPPWLLVLIIVMALLLIIGAGVLIWICCCNTVQRGKVQDVNHMAFKVPLNAVPPPPFTPGQISSFNIRMSIMDPNHKVAPSVIQVTSDDPLLNLDDFKIEEDGVSPSPLITAPPVPDSAAAPALELSDIESGELAPAPEAEAETQAEAETETTPESEEQRLQREAKQAQEKAEKDAEQTRQAEKEKTEESDDSMPMMDLD